MGEQLMQNEWATILRIVTLNKEIDLTRQTTKTVGILSYSQTLPLSFHT